MEAVAVQDKGGKTSSRSLWALAGTLVLLAAMMAAGLTNNAKAQLPIPIPPIPTLPPLYPIPTPTPTPSGTPFQSPPSQPPPTQQPTGPRLMTPFPVIRTAGEFVGSRTRFTKITVAARRGANVIGRCTKLRARCRTLVTIPRKGRVRLRRLQRTFKPKSKLTIIVTSPGLIGKYVQLRTRRGKPPIRRDRCVKPGTTKPSRCPG